LGGGVGGVGGGSSGGDEEVVFLNDGCGPALLEADFGRSSRSLGYCSRWWGRFRVSVLVGEVDGFFDTFRVGEGVFFLVVVRWPAAGDEKDTEKG